jgi:HTH-type transcriptional regulator/antitoxin MqsA
MKCENCGAAKLIHDVRDIPYTYKGETTILPHVEGDFCPACDEAELGPEESRRTIDLMLAFNKQINSAAVDPQFIVAVRKKLALDQRQAAEIFGGGVNAFSRYETGKTKPPLATVKLLKLLDKYPELLQEVMAA